MASAVETNKLASTLAIVGEAIVGSTSELSTVLDLRDYDGIGYLASVADLTGAGITKVEILASAASDGSNPEVIKDSGTVAADAVDDQVFLEATAQEIAQVGSDAGKDLRYVRARLTLGNAADVVSLTAIRAYPSYAKDGLTPASTIA